MAASSASFSNPKFMQPQNVLFGIDLYVSERLLPMDLDHVSKRGICSLKGAKGASRTENDIMILPSILPRGTLNVKTASLICRSFLSSPVRTCSVWHSTVSPKACVTRSKRHVFKELKRNCTCMPGTCPVCVMGLIPNQPRAVDNPRSFVCRRIWRQCRRCAMSSYQKNPGPLHASIRA